MSSSWTSLSVLLGSLLLVLFAVGRPSGDEAGRIPRAESTAGPSTAARTMRGDAPAPESKQVQKETPAGSLDEYPLQTNPLAGCTLCHVDVEAKFVGTIHFEEAVGCQTCHGPSEGHLADENNEVKPDELFARKDVDRLCGRCHECPRPGPAKPELTADGQRKVCIDCHGPHDIALAEQHVPTNVPSNP